MSLVTCAPVDSLWRHRWPNSARYSLIVEGVLNGDLLVVGSQWPHLISGLEWLSSPIVNRRQVLRRGRGTCLEGLDHDLVAVRSRVEDPSKVAAGDLLDLRELLIDGRSVVESGCGSIFQSDLGCH
jgi:hypothetical protein